MSESTTDADVIEIEGYKLRFNQNPKKIFAQYKDKLDISEEEFFKLFTKKMTKKELADFLNKYFRK